jgi:hypothetical protein
MNLQEQIHRILEMMGKNPANELERIIKSDFSQIKTKYKSFLDNADKIIDPFFLIDKFQNYLISRIPEVLNQLKSGQGGPKFAYECFLFIKSLIDVEMKKIGSAKKFALKSLGGGKDKIKSEMMAKDIDEYLQMFSEVINFSFSIGWMDEMKKYEDNLLKWDKECTDWVWKNGKTIKNDIINTIVNNL